VSNPFSFAEATVVVVVDGVSSLGMKEGHHYPLNTDEDESVSWQSLRGRVLSRYPALNATLLRMDLADEVGSAHVHSQLNTHCFTVYIQNSHWNIVAFNHISRC
jgi:hypothetical protein